MRVHIWRHTAEQHEQRFSESCYADDNIIFTINTETIVRFIIFVSKRSRQKKKNKMIT